MNIIYLIFIQCFSINFIFANPSKYNLPVQIDNIEYLLPKTSKPNHYEIHLNVDIGSNNKDYAGYVEINITVFDKINSIILHSDGQKYDSDLSYLKFNSEKIKIIEFVETQANNFLTLHLEKEITPNNYLLILKFQQEYFQQAGLLYQTYKTQNGEENGMLGTFFQPVYARRLIPCYDEPNLKATFTFTVDHPIEYNAVSNAEIDQIKLIKNDNKKQTVFKKSPIMSTYLLALGVSKYETLEDLYDNKKLHLYTPKDQLENSKFTLNITHQSLKFFENKFEVKYDLPKLDNMILPNFGAGGMENWGLIIYGNPILLNKADSEKASRIMSVTELTCHEIAHQWFGNLVTFDWWDYVWLNEGFATYYSQVCGDMLMGNNKNIRFMDKSVINLRYVYGSDGNPASTKSLNHHAETPYNVMQKFDSIGYIKGSAIVRFMSLILPNFDEAIKIYLKRYQYSNVKPNDLFDVLQETMKTKDLNVNEMMKNWINLPGYPLITCNVKQDGELTVVTVHQEQFNTNPNINVNGKWWIPITYVAENDPNFNNFENIGWLTDSDEQFKFSVLNIEDNWVILNPQRAVYSRVNYDLENWRRIIEYLKGPNFKKIHPINRAQLIDDAYHLAQINKLPQEIVFDLLSYLNQEDDQYVREVGQDALRTYGILLKNTNVYPRFISFATELCGKNEAFNVLSEPNLKDLTEKAYQLFTDKKQSDSLKTFGKLIRNIFTEEEVVKTLSLTGINARNSENGHHQTRFIKEIKIGFEQNQRIKKNFIGNYNEVSEWLVKRY